MKLLNFFGWFVFLLILAFLIVSAARHGNWTPFTYAYIWEFLWIGLNMTIQVAIYSSILSLIFGTVLALLRVSQLKILSIPSTLYIELFRALPLFLIIFYCFLILPRFGMVWDALWIAVLGLTLYSSAVMAELIRAGILSIEKEQWEAAHSLGLSSWTTWVHIVLPQTFRRMMPSIVGQLITLTKDTSLASIIALPELTRQGRIIYNIYNNVLETMFVVALIYFVICYALSLLSRRLEINKNI